MKKITLLLSAMGLCISSTQAQITITSTDIASPGTLIEMVDDTMSPAGIAVGAPSATASTWSFTNINFHGLTQLNFIDPVGTPAASSFPTANLVLNEGVDYSYLLNGANSLTVQGALTNNLVQGQYGIVDFDPDITMLTYPLTYGDQFVSHAEFDSTVEDTFTGIFDSLRLKVVLSSDNQVDAFGDLTTPSDYYAQTIRLHREEMQYDTVWGYIAILNSWQVVSSTADTTHSYVWLANNQDFFVMEMEADGVSGNAVSARYIGGSNVIAGVTSQNNPLCYGSANGAVTVGATGGSSPYSFAWSDGGSGAARNDLVAGSYTVTVTEPGGSADTVGVTLVDPDSIDITLTAISPALGGANGAIDISVSGGTVAGSYGYAWSNGEITQDISNLTEGTYSVTVTDDNSCEQVESYYVGDNVSVEEIESLDVKIYPNPIQNILHVNLAEKAESLLVLDMKGRVVYESTINEDAYVINTGQWPAGVYVVTIESNGLVSRTQVIKK